MPVWPLTLSKPSNQVSSKILIQNFLFKILDLNVLIQAWLAYRLLWLSRWHLNFARWIKSWNSATNLIANIQAFCQVFTNAITFARQPFRLPTVVSQRPASPPVMWPIMKNVKKIYFCECGPTLNRSIERFQQSDSNGVILLEFSIFLTRIVLVECLESRNFSILSLWHLIIRPFKTLLSVEIWKIFILLKF